MNQGGVDTPPPAPKARRTKPLLIGCGGIVAFFVVAGILGALFGEPTPEDTRLNYTQEDTELTYFEDGYATMLEAYLSDQRDISSECLLASLYIAEAIDSGNELGPERLVARLPQREEFQDIPITPDLILEASEHCLSLFPPDARG